MVQFDIVYTCHRYVPKTTILWPRANIIPHLPMALHGVRNGAYGLANHFFARQYPHQSHGRRELRAMERTTSSERAQSSASRSSHSKGLNSVDTTRVPMPSDSGAAGEPQAEDYQTRYPTTPTRHTYTQSESHIHRSENQGTPGSVAGQDSNTDDRHDGDIVNGEVGVAIDASKSNMPIPARTR
jgi:hypothetical protein